MFVKHNPSYVAMMLKRARKVETGAVERHLAHLPSCLIG